MPSCKIRVTCEIVNTTLLKTEARKARKEFDIDTSIYHDCTVLAILVNRESIKDWIGCITLVTMNCQILLKNELMSISRFFLKLIMSVSSALLEKSFPNNWMLSEKSPSELFKCGLDDEQEATTSKIWK